MSPIKINHLKGNQRGIKRWREQVHGWNVFAMMDWKRCVGYCTVVKCWQYTLSKSFKTCTVKVHIGIDDVMVENWPVRVRRWWKRPAGHSTDASGLIWMRGTKHGKSSATTSGEVKIQKIGRWICRKGIDVKKIVCPRLFSRHKETYVSTFHPSRIINFKRSHGSLGLY